MIDAKDFRDALGRFASGVTVVTVADDDEPGGVRGMTASAFISVSLTPPLVLVSVGKKARAHSALLRAERYGISILSAEQEALSNHFAGFNTAVTPRFSELAGLAVVPDALAQLACRITDLHEAGDHTLFVGAVEAVALSDAEPLLYFRGRYGRLAP